MRYTRTYKITYESAVNKESALNTALSDLNIKSCARWDTDISDTNYGTQQKVESITEHFIDFDGEEKVLSFNYASDMSTAFKQLSEAFPDRDYFNNYKGKGDASKR